MTASWPRSGQSAHASDQWRRGNPGPVPWERTVTNSSQTVTGTTVPDAFGNQVGSTGSSSDPCMYGQFSRYRNDGDCGLTLVGARYYDAQVGRFITRDTDLSQHAYAYCSHEPADLIDPDGHNPLWQEWADIVSRLLVGDPLPPPPYWTVRRVCTVTLTPSRLPPRKRNPRAE